MGKYYVPVEVKRSRQAVRDLCVANKIRIMNTKGSLWWALNLKNGAKLNSNKFEYEEELLDWLWEHFGKED